MKLHFLGGARQVTGSQYYVEADGVRLLVDCGMHQERAYLARNWEKSTLPLRNLDAVLLTHAHVDHCGLAPKLVREGYRGPIIATSASADLAGVVLRDAAEIQAEDAAFKQKRHRKEGRHDATPVKPLFTLGDVERTLPLLQAAPYDRPVKINGHVQAVFHDAGHILGSAMIELRVTANGQPRSIVFTGDLGQIDRPIVRNPAMITRADYVVMESTYGDRHHENHGTVESQLEQVITETIGRGGKIIVPIFAIERAQELIYYLGRLLEAKRIPQVQVFLDSPMAAQVNDIFGRHRECFDEEAAEMVAAHGSLLRFPSLHVVRTVQESMNINGLAGPAIIMATSGMCTAGRIKHHLAHHIGDPASTILFVGYQSEGTLGRQILDGNPEVRIHGISRLVRAQVRQIQGISGHADREGLLKWLGYFQQPPRHLFVTHGEPQASLALADDIRRQLGWNVSVPEYRETAQLDLPEAS
ncbi:MAG: MBL fold metallo-hydrolase [Planctomycetaceae bacterium]|nr:MBL fold metallo-hydrolase [Planctomycetaceae bacterium]